MFLLRERAFKCWKNSAPGINQTVKEKRERIISGSYLNSGFTSQCCVLLSKPLTSHALRSFCDVGGDNLVSTGPRATCPSPFFFTIPDSVHNTRPPGLSCSHSLDFGIHAEVFRHSLRIKQRPIHRLGNLTLTQWEGDPISTLDLSGHD